MVEGDVKRGEIALVRGAHLSDDVLLAAAFLASADHGGGAMRVVSADIRSVVAAQFLEPHPHVGLDVLDQMANMDVAIDVRQRGGDEQAARHGRSVLWLLSA